MRRASEADRLWFGRHPGESKRVRPRIEGEFYLSEPGVPPEAHWVVVEQLEPGVRTRRPLVIFGFGGAA